MELDQNLFILNKISKIICVQLYSKTSCFQSNVRAEGVTVAIINNVSFIPQCMLPQKHCLNRKVKSLKQCFCQNSVKCQKVQQVFEVLSFGLDTGLLSFCDSFIALPMIILLKVNSEICCSGVSSCYCCYAKHTTDSKPI